MAEVRLTKGKGDFVKWQTKEGIVQVCLCVYNADVASGCVSQVPPKLLESVMENKGLYTEETKESSIKKYGKLPDGRCIECYSKRKNKGNIFPKEVDLKTKKDFKTYSPEVLRLSRDTEFGHEIYRKTLHELLDLCTEYNTRVIFPTKMLEFDKEIGKKIKGLEGIISFSLGNKFTQKGVNSYGFTDKWRIKQAEKYEDFGVNTTLTLVADITDSIENNEERGFPVLDFLNSYVKTKRIIPIRLISKKVALMATGIEWEDLLNPEGVMGHIQGWEKYTPEQQQRILSKLYIKRDNGDLVANFVHEDFKEFEKNMRFCGQIGEFEYCDKCNLTPENEFVKFPISEIYKVTYKDPKKLLNRKKKISAKRKGAPKNKEKNNNKSTQKKIKF